MLDSPISGAEYIARSLKSYGVTHVFCVLAILRNTMPHLENAGIRRISAHSEKAAAYMADGYARVSRRPGIAMAQSVGAANLAAGLQDAYLAHSPVIAFTGRKPLSAQYKNAYQEIRHAPVFQAVTKYQANVDCGTQLPTLLRQAFREATSGASQPVHLDILGLAGECIETQTIHDDLSPEQKYTTFPAHRIEPDAADINTAVDMLRSARKPILICGIGSVYSDARDEILGLSQTLSIPIASSCHCKGFIPDSYPLYAGTVGTYFCASANRLTAQADLVIYVGSGVSDQVTIDWTLPDPEVSKIQIDINPSELGKGYRNTFGILGDAKKTVSKILEAIEAVPAKSLWAKTAEAVISEWKDDIEPLRSSNDTPIRPERLCKEISSILPRDGLLVADTGYSAMWASSMIHFTHQEQSFLRAAGSLGWAFPASLGAKCATPTRPVFCFIGDGGFWYHIAELETARRWNLNTITIVNNNSAFGQSIPGIDKAYGGAQGNKDELYAFRDVNFARIAREVGCEGIRVEEPKDIYPALQEALSSQLPVVVDVVTDRYCRPISSWK